MNGHWPFRRLDLDTGHSRLTSVRIAALALILVLFPAVLTAAVTVGKSDESGVSF